MSPANPLWEIEAIKQLKARYFRFMDQRDWAGLALTMTDDIVFDHPTIGRHVSRAVALAALQSRLTKLAFTAHHGSMPEIELHGSTEASGIWSLHSCVIPHAKPGEPAPGPIHGYGRYFDTYRLEDGQWRISTLRLEHLYKQS